MKLNPFQYEITLKANALSGGSKGRDSMLPYLYPWQYGQRLYAEQNFESLIDLYKNWVYVAASRNASTVANTPMRLYVAKNKKGQRLKGYQTREVSKSTEKRIRENPTLAGISAVTKAVEFQEMVEHPFLDLMRNVNGYMNRFDLIEITQLYQELTGNSAWYILKDKMGVPREIWIIPPQNFKVVPDKKKFISGYKYIKGYDEIDIAEKDVVHFKMPNPKSVYYGVAPIVSVLEEYKLNSSINQYEDAIFRNGGGSLAGVFETESELSESDFLRLKAEIQATYGGISSAGKMPLLDHGLKYKPFGNSPKEMSYLGGRERLKEAIINAYDLSISLFAKDTNKANIQGAMWLYAKYGVQPRLIRMQEKINEKIIWNYDENIFIEFDSPVPEDREFELTQRIKHIQSGVETINEVRSEMGKEKFDSRFDEPLLPLNTTLIGEIMGRIASGTGEGNIVASPEKMRTLLDH